MSVHPPTVPNGVASNEMCVPDFEYLVAAADPHERGGLPEPVRERGSYGDRGACDSGDGSEYAGGGCVL